MPTAFPTELITNVETKSVALTSDIEAVLPDIYRAGVRANAEYTAHPLSYLEELHGSVRTFPTKVNHAPVRVSVLDEGVSSYEEALVIVAPFSDGPPRSTPSTLNAYIRSREVGFIGKHVAAPNTWNQLVKSGYTRDLLRAAGIDIPVITIFSPISLDAHEIPDKRRIADGDWSPAGKIINQVLSYAEGKVPNTVPNRDIERVHLAGASIGAANVVGGAMGVSTEREVKSVTAQELIIGPSSLSDLMLRFTVAQHVGEPSKQGIDSRTLRLGEPTFRIQAIKHGNEAMTNLRKLNAVSNLPYMRGLTNRAGILGSIDQILAQGDINLTAALAQNSSLSYEGVQHIPAANLLMLRADRGQKLGHLADELVALSALAICLNVARSR